MSNQFFIQRNGKVVGPFSPDEIKYQVGTGKIRATDQMGRVSAGPWKAIGEVPALAKLFAPSSVADPIDDLPDDDDASAYYFRGRVYEKQGKYDKAIADFAEKIRIHPDDAYTKTIRGMAYEKQANKAKAEADIAKAESLK